MSGKIKVIAAGAVAALILVIALFFLLRTTPRDIAEDFLGMIGKGEVEEAYNNYIVPDLRARQNLDVFEHTVEDLNLPNFASVSWDKIDDSQADTVKFSGQVHTRAGDKFPLEMTLTRGTDGVWLVAEFGRPDAAPTTPPAP